MNMIKKTFNKLLNIGLYDDTKNEHKKIKLLNAFCITWGVSICFFMLLDPFLSQSLDRSIVAHIFFFSYNNISFYTAKKQKVYLC